METYPIMMNMKDKVVVIVGGGLIAYRRLIGLFQAGAKITVISPVIHEKIEELLTTNQVIWKNKMFSPADLDGALFVVAATNDKIVNENVALSTRNNQLVNIVDNPEMSNFHVPARLQRGDLTISVATGGASPILSKVIQSELATIYDESYEDYLKFLAITRKQVKQLHLDQAEKMKLLKEVTDQSYRKSENKQREFLKILAGYIK